MYTKSYAIHGNGRANLGSAGIEAFVKNGRALNEIIALYPVYLLRGVSGGKERGAG